MTDNDDLIPWLKELSKYLVPAKNWDVADSYVYKSIKGRRISTNNIPDAVYTANLKKCPKCKGVADNGHDRCDPPNPYYCTKCTQGVGSEWFLNKGILK